MISQLACVISDTSALLALAKMDWLFWLKERWEQVLIPKEVWRELGQMTDTMALDKLQNARAAGWLEVCEVNSQPHPALSHLHSGEIEAISLALETCRLVNRR